MEFSYPYFIILLLLPIIFVLFKIAQKSLNKNTVLWAITIIFIVISLAVPVGMYSQKQKSTIVFCIDTSKSLSSAELQDLQQTVIKLEKDIQESIHSTKFILFGEQLKLYDKLPQKIEQDNTSNLEEALEYAFAVIHKENAQGKVIVFSDGSQQNISDKIVDKYQSFHIPIWFWHPQQREREFYLRKINVAPEFYQHQQIAFTFDYQSNFQGILDLYIMANGKPYTKTQIKVVEGEATQKLIGEPLPAGDYFFEWEIKGDNRNENNHGSAFTTVIKKPSVLLLGTPENSYLQRSLELYNINIVRTVSQNDFDAIIAVNAEENINSPFMESYLEKGGSVLWIGDKGNAEWLPAKYIPQEDKPEPKKENKTKKDPPPKNEEDPIAIETRSAAFVFIIDRSESMEGEKLELAQLSALETIKKLWTKDSIGVIAFDAEPTWILPLGPALDFEWIQRRLSQISSQGGGTIIKSALAMAYKKLRSTPAHIKHIILLSDGIGDFRSRGTIVELVAEMYQRNITITTIGIGEQLDEHLLAAISREGAGKFYVTPDHTNIKSLVIQDIDRILKIRGPIPEENIKDKDKLDIPPIPEPDDEDKKKDEKEQKESYQVQKVEPSFLLEKFTDFPVVVNYHRYQKKENAKIELQIKSPTNDPLLLYWNWRAGKVILWANNDKEWQDWKQYPEFWNTLVHYLLAKNINQPQVKLTLERHEQNNAYLKLIVFDPNNTNFKIVSEQKFTQKSTYEWETQVDLTNNAKEIKVQVINDQNIPIASKTIKIAPKYLSEYDDLKVQTDMFQKIANATKGKKIDDNNNKQIAEVTTINKKEKLDEPFIWIALLFIFVLIYNVVYLK